MAKKLFVTYNGGTESFYPCSKPTTLIVGQTYEVTSKTKRSFQTNYTLDGISGQFNSDWFDVVTSTNECNTQNTESITNTDVDSIAYSFTQPISGEDCTLLQLYLDNRKWKLTQFTVTFDTVTSISTNSNIYLGTTPNGVYIVEVIES